MCSSDLAELVAADASLHALHRQIRFSAHLNPVNIPEARAAFFAGAAAPPFTYAPATWAEEARATIDGLVIPGEHPLGVELAAAAAETRAFVDALDLRTPEAFEALAETCDWLPTPDEVYEVPPPPTGQVSPEIGAERMLVTLRDALRRRGMGDWELSWDEVLASRVLVDAARRTVRVNPRARFHEIERTSLVAHEIDVHATRGVNGERQGLHLFALGLARSLLAEEGLAVLAEERVRALPPGFETTHSLFVRAVALAEDMGFRELWDVFAPEIGVTGAWQVALRVKRGLADPARPGRYAKDTVYLRGYRRTKAWLAAGGDLAHLYVGKVGLHHPVGDWIREGWITPGPVPTMWG